MASQTWHPPLPPGWEARWDSNQKAFYYIDHSTKSTSWVDPRWMNRQTLATPASAGGGPSQGHGHGEAIPMHNMSRGASPHHSPSGRPSHSPSRQTPAPQKTETSFGDQQREEQGAMISRLKRRFPEANPVIKDVLQSCGFDEDEAVKQLMELGFESSGGGPGGSNSQSRSHSRSSHQPSPAHSAKGRQSSSSITTSPQRSTTTTPKKTAATPASHKSPAKTQVSEAEKKRYHRRLCEEFKSMEAEVVKMALEACYYDESKARITLGRVTSQWQSSDSSGRGKSAASAVTSASSSSGGSRPGHSQRPTSPVALGAKASLEPVALSQDRPTPSRTTGSSSVGGKSSVTTRTAGKKTTASTTSTTSTTTTSTTTTQRPQQKQQQQQQRAQHVTIITHGGQQVGGQVVTTQPRTRPQRPPTAERVHFGGSGLAQGPDPSLHTGPDQGYRAGPEPGLCSGPDPDLCYGPDTDLLTGASVGSDGPNPEYHSGVMPGLATGSLGSAGPNPTMRCASEHLSPIGVNQRFLQTTI